MKVLLICGSPRVGNTEYILDQIYNKLDCEKDFVLLRKQKIEHCKGCLSCLKEYECYIRDDMKDIINKMKGADTLVIGIPNYFDNVPGLFKIFADRCNPLYESKALKNKKVFFIFVGGGKTEGTKEKMLNAVHGFIKYLKLNFIGERSFRALNAADVKKEITDEILNSLLEVIK